MTPDNKRHILPYRAHLTAQRSCCLCRQMKCALQVCESFCSTALSAGLPRRGPLHSCILIGAPLPPCILSPAAETKIQELAGIVKLLRRGMKELQGRTNDFVAAACKFEKEVGQQVSGHHTGTLVGQQADCWIASAP